MQPTRVEVSRPRLCSVLYGMALEILVIGRSVHLRCVRTRLRLAFSRSAVSNSFGTNGLLTATTTSCVSRIGPNPAEGPRFVDTENPSDRLFSSGSIH